MDVQQVLHMNGGEGDSSYTNNSTIQRTVISKAKPIIEETILNLYCSSFPQCLRIADFGCSSGPNTLLVLSDHIINTINKKCHHLNRQPPEFQVFLNDLPGNDFNTIFRSLPAFYEKLNKEEKGHDELVGSCFITGVPGSFFGRLFPSQTLNFVHSSSSLHWLSRVPQGLETEVGIPLNKTNIHSDMMTSPPSVRKAYSEQFQGDFSLFLRSRAQELTPGGRMVLTFMGRRSDDPLNDDNCTHWRLLALALNDMVSEGLVDAGKLVSFNLPYYVPSDKEVKDLIQGEDSFNLDRLETFEVNWNDNMNDDKRDFVSEKFNEPGQNLAKCIRAITEAMLVSHFGEAIIDDIFSRFVNLLNIVVSMTKKD